jgi:hypothetical protein
MKENNISLSEQEASVLLQLIDLAVKSGGIAVAEAAVILSKKIEAPFKPQEEEN